MNSFTASTYGELDTRMRKDLRAIFGDGMAFSLMVGLGETYIPAFALALGMSEIKAGWIVAVPTLFGALLQLVSPAAVRTLRSHRRWVVLCTFIQALSFVALLGAAVRGSASDTVVFLMASVYWGAGMATGPAWNTWVGTLVPRAVRAKYFARRNLASQAAVMAGLIAGGLALHTGNGDRDVLPVFALLFLGAALARMVSTYCLFTQSEPQPLPRNQHGVSPAELLRRSWTTGDGRLLIYMLAVQTAVQISGPFFTPFMLRELSFSYFEYLLLISTAYAAKTIMSPFLGSIARRFGSQRLLYASGIGIVPLSALWIVSNSVPYLLCIQILGGAIWAGYELSTFLLLFERIDESERTSVLTTFNFANALALAIGALIGGALLGVLGPDRESYHVLFALSGALRVAGLILLARLRRVTFTPVPLATRTIGVRPNTGSVAAPIVSSLASPKNPE